MIGAIDIVFSGVDDEFGDMDDVSEVPPEITIIERYLSEEVTESSKLLSIYATKVYNNGKGKTREDCPEPAVQKTIEESWSKDTEEIYKKWNNTVR